MIDSHHHLWQHDPVRHAWITDDMKVIRRDFLPGDLYPHLQKHNIDGSVVVQVDQTEAETALLLSAAGSNDFIKGVVGWVDLQHPEMEARLAHFAEMKKLKGFRHIVQSERPGFLAQRAFIRGVQLLARYGFTYDLLIYHHQLEEALAFARQVPETKIVVDHIAKPSIVTGDRKQWEVYMRDLAAMPNVYCKISGMVTEAKWPGWKYRDFVPYLDGVMNAFGTARLMYGSDWPVCLVAASYDQQFAIVQKYLQAFTPAEKKLILGGNAERFYNL